MMVTDLVGDYYDETEENVNNKTKDDLYYLMVDNFGDYLQEVYDKECD